MMFLLSIIAIAVFQMFFGMIWYSPKLFGGIFMKYVPMPEMTKEEQKKLMMSSMIKGIINSIVKAVIIIFLLSFNDMFWGQFMIVVLATLLAIAVVYNDTIWRGDKPALFLVNAGYSIIVYPVSAIIALLIM